MLISLVITVYNEADNISPLIESIQSAMEGYEHEIIFVDDGSLDQTRNMVMSNATNSVKLISLNKNYGQTTAMMAGIDHALGDLIVTLDGDLQNDPRDIPAMIKELQSGDWDVVAGVRAKRKDGVLLRKFPSRMANALIRKLTGVYLHDYGCTLKVFKKEIAKNLGLYGELHRFIPVLAQLQGAKLTEIPVSHHPRIYGKSKYGLGRTFKVLSDLMLMVFFQKYLQKPMHIFGTTGILTFLAGMIITGYLGVVKLMGQDIWGRPLLILGITLLLGGIQLITIGIVAELIVRIYFEARDRKTYRIKDIYTGAEQTEKVH